ncbi:MAG TPA: hypothetical protein DIS84_01005 [Corynebacterium stationis]|nr:hypothetical protein [Corynebacterium stationis]
MFKLDHAHQYMANSFDRNQKEDQILIEGKLFPRYRESMKIHHKTGFTLGAIAMACALAVLATALVGGTSNTGFTVVSALLTIALGAVVIYWSTSPKHRDRMNSEGH